MDDYEQRKNGHPRESVRHVNVKVTHFLFNVAL